MKRRVVLCLLFLSLPVSVFAYRTTITHTAYNVTTSSTTALAANVNRNYLRLQNDGDTRIYCKFNAAAVINEGFSLAASGTVGDVQEWIRAVPTVQVRCIHGGAGNKVLLISEGVQ